MQSVPVILSAPGSDQGVVGHVEFPVTEEVQERLREVADLVDRHHLNAASVQVADERPLPRVATVLCMYGTHLVGLDNSDPVPLEKLLTAVQEFAQGVPPESRTCTWYERDGRVYLDDPEWIDE